MLAGQDVPTCRMLLQHKKQISVDELSPKNHCQVLRWKKSRTLPVNGRISALIVLSIWTGKACHEAMIVGVADLAFIAIMDDSSAQK
jgi:hypothetical protein